MNITLSTFFDRINKTKYFKMILLSIADVLLILIAVVVFQIEGSQPILQNESGSTESLKPDPYGISIEIDETTRFTDGYLIEGRVVQKDSSNGSLMSLDKSNFSVLDAQGNQLPVLGFSNSQFYLPSSVPIQIFVSTDKRQEELNLQFRSLNFVYYDEERQSKFQIPEIQPNSGPIPIDHSLSINGHNFNIQTVEFSNHPLYGQIQLSISADANISSLKINQLSNVDNMENFYQDSIIAGNHFLLTTELDHDAAKKNTDYYISNFTFSQSGSWQITWNPETISQNRNVQTSEFSDSCLTDLSLERVITEQSGFGFPEEISGNLLVTDSFNPVNNPTDIMILKLPEFSPVQTYQLKDWIQYDPVRLSTDSKYLVYVEEKDESIHLINTITEDESVINEGDGFVDNIIFSQDSERMTFSKGGEIYQTYLPKMETKNIPYSGDYAYISDWIEENKKILDISFLPKASAGTIYLYDIETGEKVKAFGLETTPIIPVVSPDKARILYGDTLQSIMTSGIFIADLDGKNKRLVSVNKNVNSVTWSPDSKWVIISTSSSEDWRETVNILVDPVTCDSYLLPLNGWDVRSWTN